MNRLARSVAASASVLFVVGCVSPIPVTSPGATSTSTPAGSSVIQPSDVTIDTQGLPWSWQANLIPETPYSDDQPPGATGLPMHTEVNFGVVDPDDRQPGDPILYIIPVDPYRQMWDEAGNPQVSTTIEQVFRWTIALQSPPPTSGLPALPPEEVAGVNDLAVQIARTAPALESASRSGYRFVGRWAQDANPVTNQGLRYVYQGFTNDGAYLVTFFYPVTSPALGAIEDLSADEWDVFNADPQAYIQAQAEALNALAPSEWEPDLSTLDAVVDSLRIQGTPATGLHNGVWTWTPTDPSSTEGASLAEPGFHVRYGEDGVFEFNVGCNTASGQYTWSGGMVGGLRTEEINTTLKDCLRDDAPQEPVSAMSAAQDYRVQPGGTRLHLNMPAGGPVVEFTLDGPATEP